MKKQRMLIFLFLMLTALAACSPGHTGTDVIAFLRDGHLWTIDPDGANAFEVVSQDPPVVSYSWSPNHHLLSFRSLDTSFAKTAAGKQLASNPITGIVGDVPSSANTIGVDGGTPITIAFSSPDIKYSDAMWDTASTRLLFRQTPFSTPISPASYTWWVSQNDQPGGIAIKSLPGSYAIPSLSYNSQNYKAIGISQRGIFTTTLAGTNLHYLTQALPPGHPLSTSLERILWRPAHQDNSFLYAVATTQQKPGLSGLEVQLVLRTLDGTTTTLATCTCSQFAWSPDGNAIVYNTGSSQFMVVRLQDHSTFTIAGEANSVPYWSPDSKFLLLDGPHTLVLANVVQKQQKILLSDGAAPDTTAKMSAPPTALNALLQPVLDSIWAADSRHFLFLSRNRRIWQGDALSTGKGLYTVAIDDAGRPQDKPGIVDSGNDTQAGWTFQDANTSFLY